MSKNNEKFEYVESISFTDDTEEQIITITTKYAILLFETTKLAFELKIDNLPPEITTRISNCKLLYNTRILGFIYHEKMKEEDEKKLKELKLLKRSSSKIQIERDQTLVIVDIEYNRVLGRIKIKGKIDDYELGQNFIIIQKKSLNKIFLFKTSTLEYFTEIENVNLGKVRCKENIQIEGLSPISTNNKLINSGNIDTSSSKDNNDDSENNQNKIIEKEDTKSNLPNHFCVLAYQDFKNKREVVLIEYVLDGSRKNILNHRKRTFIPNFNSVGVKFIYILESYLLISSNIGNKLHIYNIHNFTLLHCIFLGDFPYDLSGIRLNNDKTIMSIITNNKYVKLFKLSQVSKKCTCLWHDDTKVSFTKKRSLFDVIKHKINSGKTPLWCKFKINFDEKDQMNNDSIVVFDQQNNQLMWVVQKNCTLKKFIFDPNRPKIIRLEKNLKLSEFYRYDMEKEVKE